MRNCVSPPSHHALILPKWLPRAAMSAKLRACQVSCMLRAHMAASPSLVQRMASSTWRDGGSPNATVGAGMWRSACAVHVHGMWRSQALIYLGFGNPVCGEAAPAQTRFELGALVFFAVRANWRKRQTMSGTQIMPILQNKLNSKCHKCPKKCAKQTKICNFINIQQHHYMTILIHW